MALMSDQGFIQILASPAFKSQLRKLAKRYHSLRLDLQLLLDELQNGNFPGDQISGTNYAAFKVRLKNSDIKKGKSAGYRVIYQLRDNDSVLLVTIYSKSDESALTAREIRAIINHFNQI